MKCFIYEMFGLWNVWFMKCLVYEMFGLWFMIEHVKL